MKKLCYFIITYTISVAVIANGGWKDICLGNYNFKLPPDLTPLDSFNTRYHLSNVFALSDSRTYRQVIQDIEENVKNKENIVLQYYGENFYILTTREQDYIKAIAVKNIHNKIVVIENNKNYMYDGYLEIDEEISKQYDADFTLMYEQFKDYVSSIELKNKDNNDFCISPNYIMRNKTPSKYELSYQKFINKYKFKINIQTQKLKIPFAEFLSIYENTRQLDFNLADIKGKLIIDNREHKDNIIRHSWVANYEIDNKPMISIFLQSSQNKNLSNKELEKIFRTILNSFKVNN